MAGAPQWRDHPERTHRGAPAGKQGWRAEVAGKCECCSTPYAIGDWLRRDDRLRITVIDGHQSAVQR